MSDEVDWQLVENARPENRRLGEVLRRLEGIYSGDSSLDWKESRRWCVEVLTAQLNSPEIQHPAYQKVLRPAQNNEGLTY
jgi:hypothetical protein